MVLRLFISGIALFGAAPIVLGCGGSDPGPLSRTAFVKQGDAICVKATKEREAAMAEAARNGGVEAGPRGLLSDVVLPPTQRMVDELSGLGLPKGAEKQAEAMLSGFEEGIEAVEANPEEALGSSAFEKANGAARAVGLTECEI